MTLCWSMDKLGPIARSVEDCALIFGAIHGADSSDITAVDRPFAWPPQRDVRSLKIGYFEGNRPAEERRAQEALKELGVRLIPIKLLAFGRAVNVTLGLPIIRTSVDHGTAFDIARQGRADAGSFVEAILLAVRLAGNN